MKRVNTLVEPVWAPGVLSGADAVAESIAAKDLNNLYRTSCYFQDKVRYQAFCAMYAVMRVVDDRVDDLLAQSHLAAADRAQAAAVVAAWHRMVRVCFSDLQPTAADRVTCNHPRINELLIAFADAVRRFPVPVQLWDEFFAAMLQDLERHQFATYGQFLEYADGAAVAPTTIYLHLIASEPRFEESVFDPPRGFDIMQCGRALGRFAYLAHVLRDLRQDVLTGKHGLWYVAVDDMTAHKVSVASLRREAVAGTTGAQQRALVRDLADRAWKLAQEGRQYLEALDGRLTADRAFVLELIIAVYEGVLHKIASCSYDVMTERHLLTDRDKERIALEIAAAHSTSTRLDRSQTQDTALSISTL